MFEKMKSAPQCERHLTSHYIIKIKGLQHRRCFQDDFGQHLRFWGADKERKENIRESVDSL